MRMVTLEKVAKIDRKAASQEECRLLPYVGLEHIEKDTGRFVPGFQISPEALLAAKLKFSSRHVLYGKLRPYLNKVALPNFDGVCTTEILPILPMEGVLDRTYLWALLLSPAFVEWASAQVSGANLPRLAPELLAKYGFTLPSLPEQQRIAAILARADRLRRLRRYALELSEGYLQAVFVEMFGDPVRNPKGWKRAKIAELGEVQTGNTPSREQSEFYGNHIEWIKSDNILDDQMFVSQSREMLSLEGLKQGRAVDSGALLVTCIAGSLSSVGDAALTNRRVAFNQQINAIAPGPDVDSMFLYGLIRIAQPHIQQNASAGMKHIITKSKLEELTLIKPPLSLQREFGQAARRYERLRAQQREALRQAEQLFAALLERAFRGAL